MEKGTIVTQAMRQLAVHGQPFNREVDMEKFYDFTRDMISAVPFPPVDVDPSQFQEKCVRIREATIGRIAVHDQELSNGKLFTTKLAILNESVGTMPDYKHADKGVKRIGAIGVILRNSEQHKHNGNFERRIDGRLSGTVDILTSGELHIANFGHAECTRCLPQDIQDDEYVMNQIGLSGLFKKALPLRHYGQKISHSQNISHKKLTPKQTHHMKQYLLDTFPLTPHR